MRFLLTTTAATVLLAGAAMTSPASAILFTSDHCDNFCGPQPTGFADITGTQLDADTVGISIELLNGNGLVGGLQGLTTFTFNLVGNPTITFNFGALTTFDVVGSATNTVGAGSIHQNGFGTFEYGIEYTGGQGGSNPFFGTLTFTIDGVTLASFAELSTGGNPNAFFALDIISGQGGVGNTGLVDCCVGSPTPFEVVPIPGPIAGAGLPGLIAACGGLLALARRRRACWHSLPARFSF
jgi:hypothetical protein